jgi:hypothetical protein
MLHIFKPDIKTTPVYTAFGHEVPIVAFAEAEALLLGYACVVVVDDELGR